MNSTFNINRFWNLLKKETIENINNIGISMLLFWSIPIIKILLFNVERDVFNEPTLASERMLSIFLIASIISGFAPEKLYRNYNNSKTGIYRALLPASNLEKFTSMILHCVIITPLCYFIGAVIIDTILTVIPGTAYDGFLFSNSVSLNIPQESEISNNLILLLLFSSSMSIGIFVFFNTVFKKRKFGKTLLSIFAFTILLFMIFARTYEFIESCVREMTSTTFFGTLITINIIIAIALFYGTYLRIRNQKY